MQKYGRKQEILLDVERNATERDEGIPKYIHLRLDLTTGAMQLHTEATEKKQTPSLNGNEEINIITDVPHIFRFTHVDK